MTEAVIRSVINPVVSSVFGARGGDGPIVGCPLYFLTPGDGDTLVAVNITGEVIINLATFNGDTGLAAPLQGQPLTDSPEEAREDFDLLKWNTVAADVTDLKEVCDDTFDGVVNFVIIDTVYYVFGKVLTYPTKISIQNINPDNLKLGSCDNIPKPSGEWIDGDPWYDSEPWYDGD